MKKLEKLDDSHFQRLAPGQAAQAFGGQLLYCNTGKTRGLAGNVENDYEQDGFFYPF